jgi:hypothetical protein
MVGAIVETELPSTSAITTPKNKTKFTKPNEKTKQKL